MKVYVQAILGGITAAVATAIPLVDDGLLTSEALSICLAGLVGTGLTGYTPKQPLAGYASKQPLG